MRIGIIGHFGGEEIFSNGQTIKTRSLYESFLSRNVCGGNIDKADTYYLRKKPIKFFNDLFYCLKNDEKIVLLVSTKGRRFLSPILYRYVKTKNLEVYHYVIGSGLLNEAKKSPRLCKYLSSFKGNWMESRIQAKQLQEMGLSNAIYVPNYKKLDILDPRMIRNDFSEPYPYCTFSRVVKEKGISDAISAVTSINHKMGRIVATVDVYGPVDPGYKTEFEKLLAQSDGACKYVGVASAEESVSILKNYYSLLFPTYWLSEGMPGTIIDAMSAGLPVIARRWLFCDELITNRQNGLVYDFDKPEELENCIAWSMSHKNKMIAMRKNCLEAARQYSEDIVIPQILTLMGIN